MATAHPRLHGPLSGGEKVTSDYECCTYAELPGIGIHQLITGDADDAATTARFTWDGHDLTADHWGRCPRKPWTAVT